MSTILDKIIRKKDKEESEEGLFNPYNYPVLSDEAIWKEDWNPILPPSGSFQINPTEVPMELITLSSGTGTFPPGLPGYTYSQFPTIHQSPLDISDDMVDRLWKKMYERPVIVRCGHCNSHNVITNPTCIQCGAPMGDYKEMRK